MPASKGPLSVVNPSLASQWSSRNTLSPNDVTSTSGVRAWWTCELGHEWEASIRDRRAGTGCPFCKNRRVLTGFNDLATVHPVFAAHWHPSKNGSLTPETVLASSHKKVWWKCPVDGYEWQAAVSLRVRQKPDSCPTCSGSTTVPGLNDFTTRFPDVATEWHPTRNGTTDPSTLSGSSGKKFWWIGACGHEWDASIRNRTYRKSGCPVCAGVSVIEGDNDLATTYPKVASQWHPTKNIMKPTQVVPGSERSIWWMCSEGHEWQATPAGRTQSDAAQCPVCSNQTVIAGVNDVFTTHPVAKTEWAKSNTVDPLTVSAGSATRVRWTCPTDGHEWETTVASRFGSRPTGCPACSGRKRVVGVNDLATTHPELAEQLRDADPTTLGMGSGNVWWKCPVDGHEWGASVHSRTAGGRGCPVCAGKAVVAGLNDLATTHPGVALEWSPRNDKLSTEVVAGSKFRAEWVCLTNPDHVWSTSVSNRANLGSRCPQCSKKMVSSRGEDALAEAVKTVAEPLGFSVERNIRGLIGGKVELDIYVPELKLAFEFNGAYFHSSAHRDKHYHEDKFAACQRNGIHLIQVWEDTWNAYRDAVASRVEALIRKMADDVVDYGAVTPCVVDECEANTVLASHSVGDGVKFCSHYGLRSPSGELLTVMSIHMNSDREAEIMRYVEVSPVSNGFALLTEFVESQLADTVSRIVVTDHLDWSRADEYTAGGFTVKKELPAEYMYLKPGMCRREHRLAYPAERFKSDPDFQFVDGLSATELADLNGLYRCYDSGKLRFEKRF